MVNRTHLRLRPRCASCAATTTKPRTITGEEFLNASTARPTRSIPRSTTSRAAATDAFDAAFAEGHQLSLDETVAYIIARSRPTDTARDRLGRPHAHRADIVDEVCRGLTNPQVAEQLLMSRDTVKSHLSHIYATVGVANHGGTRGGSAQCGERHGGLIRSSECCSAR